MSASDPSDDAGVTAYLFGLKPQGTKFGIDRMRRLSDALGHPERGHLEPLRLGEHRLDLRCTVEHRVFGVVMQVHERP